MGGELSLWRLFSCSGFGWLGFTALRTYLTLRQYEPLLRQPPYNPKTIVGEQLEAIAGIYLFAWCLILLSSLSSARGGALIVIVFFDLIGMIPFVVALAFQSNYIPHSPSQCTTAVPWQVPTGVKSIFDLLAGPQGSSTDVYRQCSRQTVAWILGVCMVSCFAYGGFTNICGCMDELQKPISYWRFDINGRKKKQKWQTIVWKFPLFVIEYGLEWGWYALPQQFKAYRRSRRRFRVKYPQYKQMEVSAQNQLKRQMSLPFGSPSLDDQPAEILNEITSITKKNSVPNTQVVARETASSSASFVTANNGGHIILTEKFHEQAPPFLTRLPYDIILDNILPFLHYSDVMHLLLTSRATYHALLPQPFATRKLLYQRTCLATKVRNQSENLRMTGRDIFCFGCATPVCPSCSLSKWTMETPTTIHMRTCQIICEKCFVSILTKPKRYGDRVKPRRCTCNHHGRITALTPAPASHDRFICTTCETLTTLQLQKKREKRFRNHPAKPQELDPGGRRCAYECSNCQELIKFEQKIQPMWFMCKDCGKECAHESHDHLVLEDKVLWSKKVPPGVVDLSWTWERPPALLL